MLVTLGILTGGMGGRAIKTRGSVPVIMSVLVVSSFLYFSRMLYQEMNGVWFNKKSWIASSFISHTYVIDNDDDKLCE